MLYYLFNWLDEQYDFPGAGMFQYLSFRAGMAVLLSLIISIIIGKWIIKYLQKQQIGESVRDLGLEGQLSKKGTPTMGGLIIIAALLIPVLLLADLKNIYVILMLIVTVWMGLIGFLDDYIKVFRKNKEGLRAKFKLMGQVGLGTIVGLVLYFSDDIKLRDYDHIYVYEVENGHAVGRPIETYPSNDVRLEGDGIMDKDGERFLSHDTRSTKSTIPLVKNNEFDYEWLVSWADGAVLVDVDVDVDVEVAVVVLVAKIAAAATVELSASSFSNPSCLHELYASKILRQTIRLFEFNLLFIICNPLKIYLVQLLNTILISKFI